MTAITGNPRVASEPDMPLDILIYTTYKFTAQAIGRGI